MALGQDLFADLIFQWFLFYIISKQDNLSLLQLLFCVLFGVFFFHLFLKIMLGNDSI